MEGSEKMKEQTTIRLPSEMKEEIQREAEERYHDVESKTLTMFFRYSIMALFYLLIAFIFSVRVACMSFIFQFVISFIVPKMKSETGVRKENVRNDKQ